MVTLPFGAEKRPGMTLIGYNLKDMAANLPAWSLTRGWRQLGRMPGPRVEESRSSSWPGHGFTEAWIYRGMDFEAKAYDIRLDK